MEKELIKLIGIDSLMEALTLDQSNVNFVTSIKSDDIETLVYEIKSNIFSNPYKTKLKMKDDNVFGYSCSCPEFLVENKCKHVGACLIKLFDINITDNTNLLSSVIVNELYSNKRDFINLELILEFPSYFDGCLVKIKSGIDKMYVITNKFKSFMNLYISDNGKMTLGKEFNYDSTKHKFNREDEAIAIFLFQCEFEYGYIYVESQELEKFFNLIKNKNVTITDFGVVNGYSEDCPFNINIEKTDDKYQVTFSNEENYIDLFNQYIIKDKIYLIPLNLRLLLKAMTNLNINKLLLKEEEMILLSKNIYEDIKEKINAPKDVLNIIEIKTPKVKMYFDFKDDIKCKLIFVYNDEVNYFDETKSFRNDIYEDSIISELKSKKFIITDEIIMSNLNDMVDFIEKGIHELKHEIYTTEKFKNAHITKNDIKSQFSIGKDNIMSYQFDLGLIEQSELKNIFSDMNKEKYYRLKSGQILNLEASNLYELKEVMETIDTYDLNGTIPKYRSLYLDSIKKYEIVNIDNSFKNFIDNFNKYKDLDISLSKDDLKILRNYQITGVRWLYNIYKCGFGGILADEMGLGKTIQTIMFLKILLKEKNCKILIVTPTSLIYNWEKEFEKFGNNLKFKVIAENKEQRIKDLNDDYNIYITSYGRFRLDFDEYNKKDFELIIIDEAQNIKNPKAAISKAVKSVKSNIKIALTGTPLENSVLEIWSLFDFIMPGYLNSLTKFQAKFNIKDVDEDGRRTLKLLNNLIKPFILRRKKNEVLLDLPEKLENNIYIDLPLEQKKVYAALVKKSKEEFDKLMSEEGFLKARFKILQLLTKLRQTCISPELIMNNYDGVSIKIEEVLNLVKSYTSNGHKILLFTSFKSALNIVKEKLDENKITNYVIDGSVSSLKRTQLVDAFNKDNTNVFLITLKAGGTGLNLTSADIVIHLDMWWNPQVENQATDRAHRIGQKNKVEVIKLICKGTIEEKILELQKKKKILNDILIEEDKKDEIILSSLTENDVKDLLAYTE